MFKLPLLFENVIFILKSNIMILKILIRFYFTIFLSVCDIVKLYSCNRPISLSILYSNFIISLNKNDVNALFNKFQEFYQKGEYEKAIEIGLQLKKISFETFGEKHPNYATSLNKLGLLYFNVGNYQEAEKYYLQAKEIRRQTIGELHPDYATSLNKLGLLYSDMGNYPNAEKYYLQAKEIYRQTVGELHPNYATSLNNLGLLYFNVGNYQEAEKHYLQAKEIYRQTVGELHPNYATSLNNLGLLYFNVGNYQEAEEYLLQAKEIYRQTVGEKHPDYAESLNNLGLLYSRMGNYQEAEKHYLQAKEIRRQTLGEKHPDYATSLNNLGGLYSRMGNYQEAEEYLLQAKEIYRQTVGDKDPSYATSLNNLGLLYSDMGNYQEAEKHYLQAKEIYRQTVGDKDPSYATSLNNLGLLYFNVGNYQEAEKHYLQAKEIYRQIVGDKHPDYAESLNNLGELYSRMGNYQEAEKHYLQAKEIRRQTLGEKHPDYATSLNNLGGLYSRMGNYQEAEEYLLQAKEIYRQTVGDKDPSYATSLNNLGSLYYRMGNYSNAEKYYLQAKEIYRQTIGEKHPNYANSLNSLGGLYFNVGNYQEAEKHYLQAKEIYRQTVGEKHPDYANSLNNLGLLYSDMGNYQEAEKHYLQAKEIRRQIVGEKHASYANSLNNLGGLYYRMGNYSNAEKYYLQAKEIYRQTIGELHTDYANSLNNLGSLYYRMGNYSNAEKYYLQAKEIYRQTIGEKHPYYATSLNSLGGLYFNKGNYQEAEKHYLQAKEIRRQTIGELHPDYATSLNNLGSLYIVTKKYRESIKLFEKSSNIDTNMIDQIFSFGSENERMLFLENNNHQRDSTISAYFHINQLDVEDIIKQEYLEFVSNLILSRKGIGLEALQIQRRVAQTILNNKDYPVFQEKWTEYNSVRRKLSQIIEQNTSADVEKYNNEISNLTIQKERLEKELTRLISEIQNKDDSFGHNKSEIPNFKDITLEKILKYVPIDCLIIEYLRYNKYHFNSEDYDKESEHRRYLKIVPSYAALVISSNDNSSNLILNNNDNKINNSNIHLVDLGDAEIIDEKIKEFKDILIQDREQRSIRHAYSMQSSKSLSTSLDYNKKLLEAGNRIRSIIFDPLMKYFENNTGNDRKEKRLLIAPDSVLSLLPFQCLPIISADDNVDDNDTDNHIQYILDKYAISYLGTARDIAKINDSNTEKLVKPKYIVIADPDYDYDYSNMGYISNSLRTRSTHSSLRNYSLSFDRLEGTRIEGRNIAKILNVNPWLGGDAREYKLKEECNDSKYSPTILHIATHGFFFESSDDEINTNNRRSGIPNISVIPIKQNRQEQLLSNTKTKKHDDPLLNSGLALAGANRWFNKKIYSDENENGILTAEDVITGLNLSSTELVVLSACDTGVGKIVNGEGVYGLRRAFVLAGAQTIVMSLWKVSDRHTQELMEMFYKNMKDGIRRDDERDNDNNNKKVISRAEALRKAQLEIKAKYKDPYYWGAFICQGNPGELNI
jgi:tetratricopeptide (TPR) repeat protein